MKPCHPPRDPAPARRQPRAPSPKSEEPELEVYKNANACRDIAGRLGRDEVEYLETELLCSRQVPKDRRATLEKAAAEDDLADVFAKPGLPPVSSPCIFRARLFCRCFGLHEAVQLKDGVRASAIARRSCSTTGAGIAGTCFSCSGL